MPLTLNLSVTLTDAQLSEIRGATPVVVPPPVVVVPPVVVPPEVPTPPAVKRHFGYYGAPTTAENADHTSFTFAPGWDGSGLPLTRPTVLFAPSGESLLPVLQKVKEQGGLHHIIALYPQDEPAENGLNDEQTIAKFEAARQAARQVGMDPIPPIMVCYGNKGRPGVANANIIGLDWYEHGPQKIELRRAGQKRFYIPGSCNPWREDPVQFAQAALDDPDAWGVVCFIWVDQWGGTQHLGVRSNGTVARHREAYVKLGWSAPSVVDPVQPPPAQPTEPFDEAFYLAANPDVAAAVLAGAFTSGWHHYDTNGRAEGRLPLPATAPVTPPPVVVPPPLGWQPRDVYSSLSALKSDLRGKAFSQFISLDGVEVQSGFGPAINFYTQPNGTISTTAPARKKGDALQSSYGSVAELLADAAAVGWTWTILVDGNPIISGFEADVPALYQTQRGGKLVKA